MPTNSPHGIDPVFEKAKELGASDVHIATGAPIVFRIDGMLLPQTEKPVTAADAVQLVKMTLGENGWKRFEKDRELDSSYQLKDGTRLRVNCAFERGNPTLVARIIPTVIPTLEQLGLDEIAPSICNHHEGLVLFTGPTGSGKSTSLAAIISALTSELPLNIITLEDPIEFQLPSGKGLVQQRELGVDFPNFAEGLKHVLRQDPDVVMVGEMRDLESIALALTLAETGHLVLATLHTPNASQTVDRIVDVFPPHQQAQVRMQLSLSLKAVVAQRLIPQKGGGRIANREILVRTPAVANIIRENRVQELSSVIQTGSGDGMVTFEKDLKRLAKEGLIED